MQPLRYPPAMPNGSEWIIVALYPLIGLYVLYWVVRLAVRDGTRDAAKRSTADQ